LFDQEMLSMARLFDLLVDEWGKTALYSDLGNMIASRLYVLNRSILQTEMKIQDAYVKSLHALPYDVVPETNDRVEKRIKKREKTAIVGPAGGEGG